MCVHVEDFLLKEGNPPVVTTKFNLAKSHLWRCVCGPYRRPQRTVPTDSCKNKDQEDMTKNGDLLRNYPTCLSY